MTEFPRVSLRDLPAVTASQMREIDRLAVDEFGIDLVEMMELAGFNLGRSAAALLGGVDGRRITVLVGPGNNGAGGLVAARQLANRGANVHVLLALPVGRLRHAARDRLATLVEMRVPSCVAEWDCSEVEVHDLLAGSDLLIDALLGYGSEGPPRGAVGTLIERVAASGTPVLSLDLPSGIDPDTGVVDGAALRADATMTVALPKRGLLEEHGRERSGRLYLADIGLPQALYHRVGLRFEDPFISGPVVCLD